MDYNVQVLLAKIIFVHLKELKSEWRPKSRAEAALRGGPMHADEILNFFVTYQKNTKAESKCQPHMRDKTAFHIAAEAGHVHRVVELNLENLETRDDDGLTALAQASLFVVELNFPEFRRPRHRRQQANRLRRVAASSLCQQIAMGVGL
ncbi:hypothetical protein CFP56_033149 [Quercus suber]|uniref:Uncharacterized protein n=1 Tax=Quercus suber TaxID=58331 RepID=A0AAW0JF11_QUESU